MVHDKDVPVIFIKVKMYTIRLLNSDYGRRDRQDLRELHPLLIALG